jgi:predicted nucleic acid-binding protein
LDTSVFIVREADRPSGELPDRVAVSVVTIGELQLGVLNAPDDLARARRAGTLALARTADPLPITEAIMVTWARLVSDCRKAGLHKTVKLGDALIAATAIEHGPPAMSRDRTLPWEHDRSRTHRPRRVPYLPRWQRVRLDRR